MYICTCINNDESLTPQIKFIHYMYVVESVEPEFSNPVIYMCLSNQCLVICHRECGSRALGLKSCDLDIYISQTDVRWLITMERGATAILYIQCCVLIGQLLINEILSCTVQLVHLQVHCNTGPSCFVYSITLDEWSFLHGSCIKRHLKVVHCNYGWLISKKPPKSMHNISISKSLYSLTKK